MSARSLFSPGRFGLWIALGAITFGLTLWFMIQDDSEATIGPSTYSHSAIGHAGIAAILEAMQVPVIRSKSDSLHLAAKGLLVVAEPDVALPSDSKLAALLRAKTVLLVLPKWVGREDRKRAGWIDQAGPALPIFAQQTLAAAIGTGEVLPQEMTETWRRNDLGPTPHFTDGVQLVKSDRLTPVVAAEEGILLGEFNASGRKIWVLSDPDVIANHGLAEGNAEFALALFQRLRGSGPVVFDESVHGFEPVARNPFDLIWQRRFAAMTIEALAAILLLLWATLGRFGAAENSPPPLGAGKRALIRNMAELMDYAGHRHVLVRRYVDATIRNAAAQLHLPRGLDGAASLAWLQRRAEARGGTIDAITVNQRAATLAASRKKDPRALFEVARAIRQWKQELMDGSATGATDRGGHTRRGEKGGGRPG